MTHTPTDAVKLVAELREYAATEHGKRSRLHTSIMQQVFADPARLADLIESHSTPTEYDEGTSDRDVAVTLRWLVQHKAPSETVEAFARICQREAALATRLSQVTAERDGLARCLRQAVSLLEANDVGLGYCDMYREVLSHITTQSTEEQSAGAGGIK